MKIGYSPRTGKLHKVAIVDGRTVPACGNHKSTELADAEKFPIFLKCGKKCSKCFPEG